MKQRIAIAWLMYIGILIMLQQAGWLSHSPWWDQALFRSINQPSLPRWIDNLAVAARNPWTWAPLYLGILSWILLLKIPNAWKILCILVLAVIISDQLSATIIKPWIMRLRPCRYPETASDCRLLVHCGSGFSFVSSHASNHFALAWTLGLLFYSRWKTTGLVVGSGWASIVSWSQIRVGVHFPMDIVFGAMLGILVGISLATIFKAIKVPPAVSSELIATNSLNF